MWNDNLVECITGRNHDLWNEGWHVWNSTKWHKPVSFCGEPNKVLKITNRFRSQNWKKKSFSRNHNTTLFTHLSKHAYFIIISCIAQSSQSKSIPFKVCYPLLCMHRDELQTTGSVLTTSWEILSCDKQTHARCFPLKHHAQHPPFTLQSPHSRTQKLPTISP